MAAGLATIVTARTETLSATTTSTLATLGGLHAAMLTAGVICLVGAILAVLFLHRSVTEAS